VHGLERPEHLEQLCCYSLLEQHRPRSHLRCHRSGLCQRGQDCDGRARSYLLRYIWWLSLAFGMVNMGRFTILLCHLIRPPRRSHWLERQRPMGWTGSWLQRSWFWRLGPVLVVDLDWYMEHWILGQWRTNWAPGRRLWRPRRIRTTWGCALDFVHGDMDRLQHDLGRKHSSDVWCLHRHYHN
jgi:hypothetical protein